MAKVIAVCGATGNQGGSIARLLLQYPEQYHVRALTRDPTSAQSRALAELGAQVVKADLAVSSTLAEALRGCWGVFGVTNFYDSTIKDDPGSEERQGKNLVDAALANRVRCFVWSTLPSSRKISGGRLVSRIYEGKHHVDDYIREKNLPATFLYTGNFYENMVLRSHMKYDRDLDRVEFHQPIIKDTTEQGLGGGHESRIRQVGDRGRRAEPHLSLHRRRARHSLADLASVKNLTGKEGTYRVLPTTGVPDRDIMFQLYNELGMYGTKRLPDENVVKLGVEMHGIDDFVRKVLAPHLDLPLL